MLAKYFNNYIEYIVIQFNSFIYESVVVIRYYANPASSPSTGRKKNLTKYLRRSNNDYIDPNVHSIPGNHPFPWDNRSTASISDDKQARTRQFQSAKANYFEGIKSRHRGVWAVQRVTGLLLSLADSSSFSVEAKGNTWKGRGWRGGEKKRKGCSRQREDERAVSPSPLDTQRGILCLSSSLFTLCFSGCRAERDGTAAPSLLRPCSSNLLTYTRHGRRSTACFWNE